jgi:hypothetical protein
MKKSAVLLLLCFALGRVVAVAGEDAAAKLPAASTQKGVTFAKDIHPLFEASCVRCHSGDRPKAGLRLDTLENVLKGGKEGKVLTAGKSEDSLIVVAVARIDPEKAMPPMRQGRGGRPGGPGGPGGPPPGGPGAPGAAGGQPGQGGQGGPPPPKPLTPEQVGLVRAWIDQGAK